MPNTTDILAAARAAWFGTGHRFIALSAIVLVQAACASAQPTSLAVVADASGIDASTRVSSGIETDSVSGNYLAARHARARRDLSNAADYLRKVLDEEPGNDELIRTAILVLTTDGQVDEATALAERQLGSGTDFQVAHLLGLVADMKVGDFAAAEAHVEAMPDGGIASVLKPLMMSWALAGQDRTDDALAALEPLADNQGASDIRQMHIANINEMAGRLDAAESAYRATMTDPEAVSLRQVEMLGAMLENAGRSEEARALYDQYLEDNPQSQLLGPALDRLLQGEEAQPIVSTASQGLAEALFSVGNSLRRQAGRDMGLVFANLSIHLRPDFPLARILLGDMYEAEGQLEKANQAYSGIPSDSPFSWTARMRVASNLDQADRTEEAIAALEELAAEYPDRPEPHISRGDILRGRERFAEAVGAYDAALALIPAPGQRHWSLYYARGIAHERSNQWDMAEKDLLAALEFQPEQPYVLNYLGYSWVDKGINVDRATDMIRKAVELRPHDGYIVDSLGWAYYRLGNYEEAAKELERATELRPEDPVINDHLGDAYWKVGRYNEARFQWQRSLGLDPPDDVRQVVEDKLENGLTEGQAKAPDPDDG